MKRLQSLVHRESLSHKNKVLLSKNIQTNKLSYPFINVKCYSTFCSNGLSTVELNWCTWFYSHCWSSTSTFSTFRWETRKDIKGLKLLFVLNRKMYFFTIITIFIIRTKNNNPTNNNANHTTDFLHSTSCITLGNVNGFQFSLYSGKGKNPEQIPILVTLFKEGLLQSDKSLKTSLRFVRCPFTSLSTWKVNKTNEFVYIMKKKERV